MLVASSIVAVVVGVVLLIVQQVAAIGFADQLDWVGRWR